MFDQLEQRYLRVPALDQDYTQGSVAVEAPCDPPGGAGRAQDRVDLEALGKAKRKIQQIVEAGRQRKRQSTHVADGPLGHCRKTCPPDNASAEATEIKAPPTTPSTGPAISLLLPEDVASWEIGKPGLGKPIAARMKRRCKMDDETRSSMAQANTALIRYPRFKSAARRISANARSCHACRTNRSACPRRASPGLENLPWCRIM